MFHDGDLQSGIALAVQSQKAVLCFIYDDSETSGTWLRLLTDYWIKRDAELRMVALKIRAGSQEAGFLSPICSINSIPAIIVIKDAKVQASLQAHNVTMGQLQDRLIDAFGPEEQSRPGEATKAETSEAAEAERVNGTEPKPPASEPSGHNQGYLDLPASEGRFRLPKNAYDALRSHTDALVNSNEPAEQILNSQLGLLERLPIFRDEVKRIRSQGSHTLSESARDRLLRLPVSAINAQAKPPTTPSNDSSSAAGQQVYASASTGTPPSRNTPSQQPAQPSPPTYNGSHNIEPPNYSSSQHQAQRSDYIRLQKEREQRQRDERERIKAQIKADREERRRQEEIRKMNENAANSPVGTTGSPSEVAAGKMRSLDVRIQVRTFDGSTLRTTLPPTSTINEDVRPWIDSSTENNIPYNLKLILTPLPNKNIEASEEELSLSDLGIKGSCTMVMVPVKGYVESYTGNTPTGLIGSAVNGGYNIVTGTAGALVGGVKTFLGIGAAAPQGQVHGQTASTTVGGTGAEDAGHRQTQRNMRVRTLADQRVDDRERRGDQQFYNGNALNFAPNRGDDGEDEPEMKKD